MISIKIPKTPKNYGRFGPISDLSNAFVRIWFPPQISSIFCNDWPHHFWKESEENQWNNNEKNYVQTDRETHKQTDWYKQADR